MSGSGRVVVACALMLGVAGWLAYKPRDRQPELTPAAAYWMERARSAEGRAARLAGVLAEARAARRLAGRSAGQSPVAVIRLVFGPQADRAIRVAYCETAGTLSATAANPTDRHSDGSLGSWGLFQIGSVHREPGESVSAFRGRMFDPVQNARMAYRLSDGGRDFARDWRTCGAGL